MLDISQELDEMAEYPTNNQVQMITRMSKMQSAEYKYLGSLNAAG